jgi:hypothetical protein
MLFNSAAGGNDARKSSQLNREWATIADGLSYGVSLRLGVRHRGWFVRAWICSGARRRGHWSPVMYAAILNAILSTASSKSTRNSLWA